MDATEFLRRANTFMEAFNQSLTEHTDPPAAPDFAGFTPTTSEHYEMISSVLEQCGALAATAQAIKGRSASALTAPRLVRNDSIDTGRTLFADV